MAKSKKIGTLAVPAPAPDHSSRQHALLAASHAERWIACPPSAVLEDKYNQEHGEETSVYAEEGTLAHEFGEARLQKMFGRITPAEYEGICASLRENPLYAPEMEEEVAKYTTYVSESYSLAKKKTKDAAVFIEQILDFSSVVKDGFGTGDAGIIADGQMELIDLKYGKGVKVEAENNPQLMLYAIGALSEYSIMYDIHRVKMTIVQPRLDHISSWTATVKEILKWAAEVAEPAAKLAYEGKGLQKSGPHCKFCRVRAVCATLAANNLALAKHEFKDPHLLTEDQLLEIYAQIPKLTDWANSVSAYLLDEAIKGHKFKGYKVVEGQSRRKWADEEAVKGVLDLEGYPSEMYLKTSLAGISDIEKLVGKKNFPTLFKGLVGRTPGKPTFVSDSDPRPAYDPVDQAKTDFSE